MVELTVSFGVGVVAFNRLELTEEGRVWRSVEDGVVLAKQARHVL